MNFESRISCRSCKRSIVGIELYTQFEEHARGMGWVKEVGYTLDIWLCNECAKQRTNQEHTYSAGTSYAIVTTYCDTCRKTHTSINTGNKTAGYDLINDGWFEINSAAHRWRCPMCWRISLAEVREKVEQAANNARATVATGSATTASVHINVPETPKKPEREKRYPMCLVFMSGKEEIYYVTNKTREHVRMALVSNMAVQFDYFLLTIEDEPSGRFACPHGMIERMQ